MSRTCKSLALRSLFLVGALPWPPIATAYNCGPPPGEPEHARHRVLVVSGANNHDWEWTTPSLVSILEESGRFAVEVSYDPSRELATNEQLHELDAIVLDYNGPRWGEAAEQNFLNAVRCGVGVVVVHAANNAFPGWREYEELVGLLWREGTGHGRFHAFDVEISDRDHPVTHTLPTLIAHPDELYHRLVNPHAVDNRVLGWALSANRERRQR